MIVREDISTNPMVQEKRKILFFKAAAVIWLILVTGFFAWETIYYRGFFGSLSEWQFDLARRNFPNTTFMGLILLTGAPAIWYLARLPRDQRDDVLDADPTPQQRDVRFTIWLRNLLTIIAGIALCASIIFLALLLTLPSGTGTPKLIDLSSGTSALTNGPTTILASARHSQTALLENSITATSDGYHFVPLVPSADYSGPYRIFVQLGGEGSNALSGDRSERFTGTLVHNGLPGAIRELYRRNGYAVDQTNDVLFTSRYAMQRPMLMSALQLAILALLIGIFAYVQHRRQKKMVSPGAASDTAVTTDS